MALMARLAVSPINPPAFGRADVFTRPNKPDNHTTSRIAANFIASGNRLFSARKISTAIYISKIGSPYIAYPSILRVALCSHPSTGPPTPNHATTSRSDNTTSSTAPTCAQKPLGTSCFGAVETDFLRVDFRFFGITIFIISLYRHSHCSIFYNK